MLNVLTRDMSRSRAAKIHFIFRKDRMWSESGVPSEILALFRARPLPQEFGLRVILGWTVPPPSLEVAKESLVVNTEFRLLVFSYLRHDAVDHRARDILGQLE